jgi:hypothetical protein
VWAVSVQATMMVREEQDRLRRTLEEVPSSGPIRFMAVAGAIAGRRDEEEGLGSGEEGMMGRTGFNMMVIHTVVNLRSAIP